MNDYPVVLAHGIARFDFLREHLVRNLEAVGLALVADADRLHYFKGIASHLRAHGFDVAHTSVNFAAGVETRAANLKREVDDLLRARGKRKAHIIGHSMGGLDARHGIVNLGMADRVASLTTIGTPHFGTSFADWGITHQGDEIIRSLRDVIDLGGFADLTTAACRRFNEAAEATEAANEVFYRTYASSDERQMVFGPLQASWRIIEQAEGDNDGLVPRISQRWVAQLVGADGAAKQVRQFDFPVPADHLNQIGWWDLNQLKGVNPFETNLFAAIRDYESAIKNVYLKIVTDVRQLP